MAGEMEEHNINEQEALQLIQKQRQERVSTCRAEINEILQKYNCQLTAEVLLRQNQVIPSIIILPNGE